jgi:hypothetical protein
MSKQWSESFAASVRQWCDKMAALGADVLVDASILNKAEFDKAVQILSEELFVRLCLHDYPPSSE